jgi:predicted GH43/DUF377 family glycosyl hydrolase
MRKQLFSIAVVSLIFIFWANPSGAQVNWTKSPVNPIMSPGTGWLSYGFPFVFVMQGNDSLRMWFTAAEGTTTGNDRIGYATSSDGINFNMHSSSVFEPSGGSAFDSQGVFGASVLFDGTVYRMWYNGYATQPYYAGALQTGLATSGDGINWIRHSGNPVLAKGLTGTWDEKWAYVNTVLYMDSTYKMWYTGSDANGSCFIGYATSNDGILWDKYPGNPVLKGATGNWDALNNQNARVIYHDGKYEMWYNGNPAQNADYNIGYATSNDGISWVKYVNNPVMVTGGSGSFDADWCWAPAVIYDGSNYYMWYTGFGNNLYHVGFATDSTHTGLHPTITHEKELLVVYPNPVSTTATIKYFVDAPGKVKVSVYDRLGREVLTLLDEYRQAGSYTLSLSTTELRNGSYTCVLQHLDKTSRTNVAVAKLLVLH